MKKSPSSFLHRVPTAVMKRSGRESSSDSHTKNPSHNNLQFSTSDPFGSESGPPSPAAAGGIFHVQSPPSPLSPVAPQICFPFDSQSPARVVYPWGDTFMPQTVEEECAEDWTDEDVAADDSEAQRWWPGWIAPDTYDGFDDVGPILSGSDSEKKAAEEKVAEEKSRDEKPAEEKLLPWEDAGYIRWEKISRAFGWSSLSS